MGLVGRLRRVGWRGGRVCLLPHPSQLEDRPPDRDGEDEQKLDQPRHASDPSGYTDSARVRLRIAQPPLVRTVEAAKFHERKRTPLKRSGKPALAAAAALLIAGSVVGRAARAAESDPDLIKRGEYLSRAGDCVACHTAPGGKPFAGNLGLEMPIGTIYTPNLTPDKATGIGNWTDDQFYKAMHEGIGVKGEYLYPAFPFPWYTKVTRDDALAIKAYLFSLEPVSSERKKEKIAFPFNVREALLTWRTAFFKPGEFVPDPAKSPELNRGAYLVEGLGHCGECHNGNNLLGASDLSGRLKGGEIQGWYAPNITSDGKEGVGSWSTDELVAFLHDGSAPGRGVALGPMKETVDHSLHYLSNDDLRAMAAYLKSFSGKESYKPLDEAQAQTVGTAGAGLYLSNCASCHGLDGKGQAGMIPALAGNGAVLARGPQDVIRVVVGGVRAQQGYAPMPAAGADLTDQSVADIVNYVRTAWGNAAPGNAEAGQVADLRSKTTTLMSGQAGGKCDTTESPTSLVQSINASGIGDRLKGTRVPDLLAAIDDVLPEVRKLDGSAKSDDIVNALIAVYCPAALENSNLPALQRPALLGQFGSLVYGQLKKLDSDGTIKN